MSTLGEYSIYTVPTYNFKCLGCFDAHSFFHLSFLHPFYFFVWTIKRIFIYNSSATFFFLFIVKKVSEANVQVWYTENYAIVLFVVVEVFVCLRTGTLSVFFFLLRRLSIHNNVLMHHDAPALIQILYSPGIREESLRIPQSQPRSSLVWWRITRRRACVRVSGSASPLNLNGMIDTVWLWNIPWQHLDLIICIAWSCDSNKRRSTHERVRRCRSFAIEKWSRWNLWNAHPWNKIHEVIFSCTTIHLEQSKFNCDIKKHFMWERWEDMRWNVKSMQSISEILNLTTLIDNSDISFSSLKRVWIQESLMTV